MPNFEYPSGLWPSGMELPTERVGFSQSFEATSGTLSSQQGMAYPIAVPRIDGGEASGLQHYVPYSAQLFGAAMENIKKEYEQRGATVPTFYAYFDSSGTIKEEITSYTDLYSMPLTNFHMTIRDCYTAISGLVEMDDWGDDMTDYMRRVFDYRVLLKDIPKENRLQDSVTYYNIRLGQEVTIDPLTRARAGQFPLSLDDVKHLGSKWGTDPSGTRRYGSDDFGESGIAASPGSGLYPTGVRNPEFSNSNFMGHFDWLLQSIMWRGPFVETFNKDGDSEEKSFFNYKRGMPSGPEEGWIDGPYPNDGPSSNYKSLDNVTTVEVSDEVAGSDSDYYLKQYEWDELEIQEDPVEYPGRTKSPDYQTDTEENNLGAPIPLTGVDYGAITLAPSTSVRVYPWTHYNGKSLEDGDDWYEVEHRGVTTTAQLGTADLQELFTSPGSYVDDSVLDINSFHASDIGYDTSDGYVKTWAPTSLVSLNVFEEVILEKNANGLNVSMRDWFGTSPCSAYGEFSGYINIDGPSKDGTGLPITSWSTPVFRAGYNRLSVLESNDGVVEVCPAVTSAGNFNTFRYFGNPISEKAIHLSGTIDGTSYYTMLVEEAVQYLRGREWNYRNLLSSSRITASMVSGWDISTGGHGYTTPFFTLNPGSIGVAGTDMAGGANSAASSRTLFLSSAEYNLGFADFVEYNNDVPSESYDHVALSTSGYVASCHPMQTIAELRNSYVGTSGYSYPVGQGSEMIIDVQEDANRASVPSNVETLYGRDDWTGLHICLTTNRHLPGYIEKYRVYEGSDKYEAMEAKGASSDVLRGNVDYMTSFTFMDYAPVYQGEGWENSKANSNSKNRLGFTTWIEGFDTHGNERYQIFDPSGRLWDNVDTYYKAPSLVSTYVTRGGTSPSHVSSTQIPFMLNENNFYLNGWNDYAKYSYQQPQFASDTSDECYVTYGDINTNVNSTDYGVGRSPVMGGNFNGFFGDAWDSIYDLKDVDVPSGVHFSTWKISDYSPASGTKYVLDIWGRFKSDMAGLQSACQNGYAGHPCNGEEYVLFSDTIDGSQQDLTSSDNNWKFGIGSLAGESAPSGHDPAFGLKDDNSEGASLVSFSLVDVACAVEGVGLGEGTGYTVKEVRLKFPIILGPDGVE